MCVFVGIWHAYIYMYVCDCECVHVRVLKENSLLYDSALWDRDQRSAVGIWPHRREYPGPQDLRTTHLRTTMQRPICVLGREMNMETPILAFVLFPYPTPHLPP